MEASVRDSLQCQVCTSQSTATTSCWQQGICALSHRADSRLVTLYHFAGAETGEPGRGGDSAECCWG